jgi:hypothetical protein
VLALTPPGHTLPHLRGRGRVDGNLVGTAAFRSTSTSKVEAEGCDYPAAHAALSAMVPTEQLMLSVRVLD